MDLVLIINKLFELVKMKMTLENRIYRVVFLNDVTCFSIILNYTKQKNLIVMQYSETERSVKIKIVKKEF